MSLRLRPLVPRDMAELAALHARAHPQTAWRSPAEYAAYALEILFRNPWNDPELPSWVAELDGRMVGALGVVPRRMRLGKRTLRVAVSCQLMVEPGVRSGTVALELLKRLFSGPQDLSLADGANDPSRRVWEASGGMASTLHSLHWVHLLRPARGLLRLIGARRPVVAALAAPLAALFDLCVETPTKPPYCEEPLHAAVLHSALEKLRHYSLKPDYDPAALHWLLEQARAKRRHGELQGCLARDSAGRVAGWFLYYLSRGVSQVLQVGARRGALEAMLEQLRGVWTLLHARDSSLLVPFLRGDAFFSRLDGEWWMRFGGEPQSSTDANNRADVLLPKMTPFSAEVL